MPVKNPLFMDQKASLIGTNSLSEKFQNWSFVTLFFLYNYRNTFLSCVAIVTYTCLICCLLSSIYHQHVGYGVPFVSKLWMDWSMTSIRSNKTRSASTTSPSLRIERQRDVSGWVRFLILIVKLRILVHDLSIIWNKRHTLVGRPIEKYTIKLFIEWFC